MFEPQERTIAFICCTNDPEAFEDCSVFIRELTVPRGYSVELIPVNGAKSMTAGYNAGMRQTSAKFKIYLHQDVHILNRQFLIELLDLFRARPDVGLVGMTGAKTLPIHGKWWEALDTAGKVYGTIHGRVQLMDFGSFEGKLCEVEVVDGLLMATQHDLPWREDLLDDWHYYDVSQCMEFLKEGHRIAVPRQSAPWCLHDCGVSYSEPSFEEARRRFFDDYGLMLRMRRRRTIVADRT